MDRTASQFAELVLQLPKQTCVRGQGEGLVPQVQLHTDKLHVCSREQSKPTSNLQQTSLVSSLQHDRHTIEVCREVRLDLLRFIPPANIVNETDRVNSQFIRSIRGSAAMPL